MKKKPHGRTKPIGKRRLVLIGMWLKPEDARLVREAAQREGLPVAAYCRSLVVPIVRGPQQED